MRFIVHFLLLMENLLKLSGAVEFVTTMLWKFMNI
jgi:hypothetical protein